MSLARALELVIDEVVAHDTGVLWEWWSYLLLENREHKQFICLTVPLCIDYTGYDTASDVCVLDLGPSLSIRTKLQFLILSVKVTSLALAFQSLLTSPSKCVVCCCVTSATRRAVVDWRRSTNGLSVVDSAVPDCTRSASTTAGSPALNVCLLMIATSHLMTTMMMMMTALTT